MTEQAVRGDLERGRVTEGLARIVGEHSVALLDTNIFLQFKHEQDFLGIISDSRNYRDISIMDVKKYLARIRDFDSFTLENSFNITQGVYGELHKILELYSLNNKRLNSGLEKTESHVDGVTFENLEDLAEVVGNYGGYLNHTLQKLQHKIIGGEEDPEYVALHEGFKRLRARGIIKTKGKSKRHSRYGFSEKSDGETDVDDKLVAHAIHSALQGENVAIFSNDKGMRYLLDSASRHRGCFFGGNSEQMRAFEEVRDFDALSVYELLPGGIVLEQISSGIAI